MKKLPPEEYYKGLPGKRVSAGALFFNESEELLLVKPNYKDGWIIPGGSADANESPRQTVMREVKEETGILMFDPKLVCVSYAKACDVKTEAIHFIFSGGVLNAEQISNIRLQKEELETFRFVSLTEAKIMLAAGLKERLTACFEACKTEQIIYVES